MTKIVKTSPVGIFPLLNKRDAAFVQAAYAEKLSAMEPEVAERELLKIVNRAYAELQRVPPGLSAAERERFLQSFVRWIRIDCEHYFPQVTLSEVSIAIGRGLRQEYGPAMGFNNIAIHGFIRSYLESDDRTQALAKQHRFLLLQETADVVPPEDKWTIMRQGIIDCYEYYRKTKRIVDFGNVNYDILEKAGAINLSLDEKLVIYEVARQQVLKEQESQALNYRMAYEFRKNNQVSDLPVKIRAKEIALRGFYDTGPDLDEWMGKLHEVYHKSIQQSAVSR